MGLFNVFARADTSLWPRLFGTPASTAGTIRKGSGDHASGSDDVVLIIGAGTTGLALAQGLRKAKIPCVVFERDAGFGARSRDWNMGLHWGAPILKELICDDQWDKIQTVQVDPNEPTKHLDTLYFLNGQTGERMGAAQIDYFYRLIRSKLCRLLSENVDIRWNHKLVDIIYSQNASHIIAVFENGSSVTGRVLVGADGARSMTRKLAIGTEHHALRRIPYAATWASARFTTEQAEHLRSFHPLYIGSVHPKGRFSFFGLQDGSDVSRPETWLFFFYISYPSSFEEQDRMTSWTNAELMKHIKALASEYSDPFRSAFEWLPDNHPLWYTGMSEFDPQLPEHHWDNRKGRVTLAGDAAHAMTYQRGQGLNHSISDAASLVDAISTFWKEGDAQKAQKISEYEREMRDRAGNEVRMSTANTEMLHDWERTLQSPLFKSGLHRE